MTGETSEEVTNDVGFVVQRENEDSADSYSRLLFSARSLAGWVQLTGLELHVPGKARKLSEYQRTRSNAKGASIAISQANIDAFLADWRKGPGSSVLPGVDQIRIRSYDGYVSLSARVRESVRLADFHVRLYFVAKGDKVSLLCGPAQIYGHLQTPAPLLAHRIVSGMMGAVGLGFVGAAAGQTQIQHTVLGELEFRPLRAVLFYTLPSAGWRLPKQQDIGISRFQVSSAGIEIQFSSQPAVEAQQYMGERTALALADCLQSFSEIDALLLDGNIDGAMQGYRDSLVNQESAGKELFAIERMLSLGCSDAEYFSDSLQLARQVLGRRPDFVPAKVALANIALAQDQVETAANRYRDLAKRNKNDKFSCTLAALAGARLFRQFEPATATEMYEMVLRNWPAHQEASSVLTERYREEERWSELAVLIQRRIDACPEDAAAAAQEHLKLARVLIQLDRREAALAALLLACQLDDSIPEAYEECAVLEMAIGDVPRTLKSLEAANRLHSEFGATAERITNLLTGGDFCFEQKRIETAYEWYLDVLAIDSQNRRALIGAARTGTLLSKHGKAAGYWGQLIDSTTDLCERAQIGYELGRSLLLAGRPIEAKPSLEQAAQHGDGDVRAESHALLGHILIQEGEGQIALIHLQAAIDSLDKDVPSEAERRSELLLQRATTARNVKEFATAEENYRSAFTEAKQGSAVRQGAARALLRREEWGHQWDTELRDELAWIAELSADNTMELPQQGEDARREWAEIRTRHAVLLAQDSAYQEALRLLAAVVDDAGISDDTKLRAIELKVECLDALGFHTKWANTLERRAALSGTRTERIQRAVESAEAWCKIYEYKDGVGAAKMALSILDAEVLDGETVSQEEERTWRKRVLLCLGECLWRSRNWTEVAATYEALDEFGDSIAPEFLWRRGTALDFLGQTDVAISVLERVSNWISCSGAEESEDVTYAANSWQLLSHLYEQTGDVLKAAQTQERFAETDMPDAARADAWFRAGAVYLRNPEYSEDAKRCLEASLQLVSDHLPALDILEQLAQKERDFERLAVILGRKVAAMHRHPKRMRGLLVRLAELYEQELSQPDVATHTYQRVLSLFPNYRPALRHAARNAQECGRWGEACESYIKLSGVLEEDDELSYSAEELASSRRAARDSLAALVPSLEDPVLLEKLGALAQEDSQLSLLLANPRANSKPLVSKVKAHIHGGEWESALQLLAPYDKSGDDIELLWLHVEVTLALSKPDKAMAILPCIAEHAGRTGDLATEHRAVRRLADLTLDSEGPIDIVCALYERALEIDPGDIVAAELHAELVRERDSVKAGGFSSIGSAITGAGQHHSVTIRQLEMRLESPIADPKEHASLLFQLGRAYQHESGDRRAAVEAYEKALSTRPGHVETLDALADICYREKDWARAHTLYKQVPADKSVLPVAVLARRKAEIEEALGSEQGALRAFQAALEFAPQDSKVLAGICRCAIRLGQHGDALAAQRALIGIIPIEQVERVNNARLALAELCEHIGDVDTAIESYEEILRDQPDSHTSLARIRPLYLKAGRVADAARVLQSQLSVVPSPQQRAQLLYELGTMYSGLEGQSELATEAYLKAIDLDPEHGATLQWLLGYYCREGDFQSVCEIAHDLQKQHLLGPPIERVLLHRAALAAALCSDVRLYQDIVELYGDRALENLAHAVIDTYLLENAPATERLALATQSLCSTSENTLVELLEVLVTPQKPEGIDELLAALEQLA